MAFDPNFAFRNLDTKVGINKLLAEINKLDDASRQIILRAISTQLTDAQKQHVLALLRSQVATTDAAVRNWLIQGITGAYVAGANYTVKALRAINFKAPAGLGGGLQTITPELITTVPFMQPHLAAVNVLLSSAYTDFASTMTGFIKGAENILNDTIRRQIRSQIAEGRLEGSSIKTIKNTVKETLGDQGFTVLLDRGGREWQLGQYSEMLTRTHINKAANEAMINRMGDFEVDIVEVSSNGATDELCSSQEGALYSISGNSENYPPLDGNEPPYHPNCTHNLIPRPDLH